MCVGGLGGGGEGNREQKEGWRGREWKRVDLETCVGILHGRVDEMWKICMGMLVSMAIGQASLRQVYGCSMMILNCVISDLKNKQWVPLSPKP